MCRWDGGDEELVLVVTNAEADDEAAPMATAAAVAANDFMLIICGLLRYHAFCLACYVGATAIIIIRHPSRH
jgi:hypothetical protein